MFLTEIEVHNLLLLELEFLNVKAVWVLGIKVFLRVCYLPSLLVYQIQKKLLDWAVELVSP